MSSRHPTQGGKGKRIQQDRPPSAKYVDTVFCRCGRLNIMVSSGVPIPCPDCGAVLRMDLDGHATVETSTAFDSAARRC
jgi:hypothetical protein